MEAWAAWQIGGDDGDGIRWWGARRRPGITGAALSPVGAAAAAVLGMPVARAGLLLNLLRLKSTLKLFKFLCL